MPPRAFALFSTPIGTCGIVWHETTPNVAWPIAGTQLPEGTEDQTRARIARRFPGAVESPAPVAIAEAIAAIGTLLRGGGRGAGSDLLDLVLDWDGVPAFHRRVYEVTRLIPPGETLTYGQIAVRLGDPGAARAVGQALGRNPFAIVVPCHRVLAASGRMHGFSASGGVTTKRRLLEIEGAVQGGLLELDKGT